MALPMLFGGGNTAQAYQISSSLLGGTGKYFTRTPASAGSLTTSTDRAYVRLSGSLSTAQYLFSAGTSTSDWEYAYFEGGTLNQLVWIKVAGGVTQWLFRSAKAFRDPGSFQELTFTRDLTNGTASERIRVYGNDGTRLTADGTTSYPGAGVSAIWGSAVPHAIGRANPPANGYFLGQIVEFVSSNGAALAGSSFSEIDPVTLNWRPKAISGITWGTNGFYLGKGGWTFASLGTDQSGQGNNWAANGFASTDVVSDSPTNIYATLSPLDWWGANATLTSGNLTATGSAATVWNVNFATLAVSSSKWIWTSKPAAAVAGYASMLVVDDSLAATATPANTAKGWDCWFETSGQIRTSNNSATINFNGSYTPGTDLLLCALDADSKKLWFGVYKVASTTTLWFDSAGGTTGNPATGANPTYTVTGTGWKFGVETYSGRSGSVNFGQTAFPFTAPAGYKTLCTSNLPAPSAAAKQPWKYYSQQLVVHNGTSSTFTVGWNPDPANGGAHTLFRFKPISAGSWTYVDTVRGLTKALWGELTNAEGTYAGLVTAASTGVCTMGSPFTAGTYLVEAWKVDPASGFDIVTYTGTGANRTITHNNGTAPKFYVVKNRSTGGNWWSYHTSLGAGSRIALDSTSAATSDTGVWQNTAPTATTIYIGGTTGALTDVNGNGNSLVGYVWSEVAGFSKFDKHIGNGNADGPLDYLGFVPGEVTYKNCTDAIYHWRHITYALNASNVAGNTLYLDLNNAQDAPASPLQDLLSSASKVRATSDNVSASTYAYSAFSRRCMGGQGVSPALAA